MRWLILSSLILLSGSGRAVANAWDAATRAAGTQTQRPAAQTQSLIDDLAHPDARKRLAAVDALANLGIDAKAALDEAKASPVPAVAQSVRRLLARIEVGATDVSPFLGDRLITAALMARSDDEGKRQRGRQTLAENVVYGAPLLAKLMVDTRADPAAFDALVQELLPLFDRSENARGIERSERAALVAELLAMGEEGVEALQMWTERSQGFAGAEAVLSNIAARPDSDAHGWFEGDADAQLPPGLFGQDQAFAEAMRRLIFDLPPSAMQGEYDAFTREIITILSQPAPVTIAHWQQADRRLLAALATAGNDGKPDTEAQIIAAALAGEMETAELIARRNPLDLHSVLWARGHLDRWEKVATDAEWAGDAQLVKELSLATLVLRETYLSAQPRREGIEDITTDGYTDLLIRTSVPDQRPSAFATLAQVEPMEPAWLWLRDRDDRAAHISLSSWESRVRAAQLVSHLADSEEDRHWARRQERLAASWAMGQGFFSYYALTFVSAGAGRDGRWEDVERYQSALLITLLRDDVRQSFDAVVSPSRTESRRAGIAISSIGELWRARMNLAQQAGNDEAAAYAYNRAIDMVSNDPSAVIERVVWLDANDRSEEADTLFATQFARMTHWVTQYPASAMFKNQVAWMAGSCGRRLDTALTLASGAVGQEPRNATYLDTLAEVLAARGEGDRAMAMTDAALSVVPPQHLPTYLRRREAIRAKLSQ